MKKLMKNNCYPFKIPYVSLKNYECDINIVKLIPEEMTRYYQIIALEKHNDILSVGMVNPDNEKTINILENKFKLKIIPIKVNIEEWANTINYSYLNRRIT